MSPGLALKLQCMGNNKVYDSQSKGTFKMGQDGVNLEWTMYESISTNSFHTLYTDTDFADVTLACEENKQILVHKVVVSSCSELLKISQCEALQKYEWVGVWIVKQNLPQQLAAAAHHHLVHQDMFVRKGDICEVCVSVKCVEGIG